MLPYKNESYINPKYVFNHQRINNTLISHVHVKDLLVDDLLAIACASMTAKDNQFCEGDEDIYIRCVAWAIACLNQCDHHCGDCTGVPQSCIKCIFEEAYGNALRDLCYFDDLLQIQFIKKYNTTILLMTIIQMQESYWDDFLGGGILPEYDVLLKQFLDLSKEEQEEQYNRMVKVMDYVKNPVPLDGIPWW
jgi:hypothetical protein